MRFRNLINSERNNNNNNKLIIKIKDQPGPKVWLYSQ